MAVTVSWIEYVSGESPGTDQGTAASNINFGNTSAVDLTPSSYPIAAGSNSYSKYFRLLFSGSFTQISNAKLWKSAGTYVTDEYVWFSGNVDYATPSTSEILSGEPDAEWTDYGTGRRIPTSQPSNNNVVLSRHATGSGGSTNTTLPEGDETNSTPGYYSGSRSAILVFQLTTSASTPAGPVNQKTISLTYDRQ